MRIAYTHTHQRINIHLLHASCMSMNLNLHKKIANLYLHPTRAFPRVLARPRPRPRYLSCHHFIYFYISSCVGAVKAKRKFVGLIDEPKKKWKVKWNDCSVQPNQTSNERILFHAVNNGWKCFPFLDIFITRNNTGLHHTAAHCNRIHTIS